MMKFFSSQSAQDSQSENTAQKKELASTNEKNHTRFCTNCGAPLEADDLFCDECGRKIEQEENAIIIEEDEVIEEQTPAAISADRMASILQTNRIKTGEATDEFKNINPLPSAAEHIMSIQEKSQHLKRNLWGTYMHKNNDMTQYLVIESVQENAVTAVVKTNFQNGSYSTEFYEGTLVENNLRLHIVSSDLHPIPDEQRFFFGTVQFVHHTIKLSEVFEGTVTGDAIFGSFTGQFGMSVVFRRC